MKERKQQRRGSGEYSNPKLAVQVLVKQTNWLDGELRWVGNRVSWTDGATTLIAEPKDLAKAQRRLYKMMEFPQVAKSVVGDVDTWLAIRQAKLEQAKRIVGIDIAPLSKKITKKKLTQKEIESLASVLVAEALCVNLPAHSAADYLFKIGSDSLAILTHLIKDDGVAEQARALASIVAGAVEHVHQLGYKLPSATTPWMKRAFAAGKASGMMPNVSTLFWFLSASKTERLLPAACAALSNPAKLSLTLEDCRELLVTGTSPFEVAQILSSLSGLEAYDDIVPSSRELSLQVEAQPKEKKMQRLPKFKKEDARPHKLAPVRQALIETLRSLPARYALRTRKSDSIRFVDEYIRATSALDKAGFHLLSLIIQILERGLNMSPELTWHYIRLLHKYQSQLPPDVREQEGYLDGTFENQNKTRVLDFLWFHVLNPFAVLLETSENPEWVEYVIECNDLIVVAQCLDEFVPDKDSLARTNSLNSRAKLNVCNAIAQLVTLIFKCKFSERDRKQLFAFLDAIGNCKQEHRDEIFRNLAPLITRSNGSLAAISAARLLVPILEYCLECDSDFIAARTFWFNQIEKYCLDREREKMISWAIKYTLAHWDEVNRSSKLLDIPMLMAGYDFKRFQKLFPVWGKYSGNPYEQLVEDGLTILLKKDPKLLDEVASAFRTRTKSTLDLLQLIALLERFQIDNPAIKTSAKVQLTANEEPWRSLLELLPDDKEQIAKLYSAAKVLNMEKLPADLQDPLERPSKMARELDYLKAQWQDEEPPPEIAQRIKMLTDSLSDADSLRLAQIEQLSNRLQQATAELHIDATRKLVLDDLVERIGITDGVASEYIDLGNQFLEAAALCSELRVNRRLMKKLLREATSGNRHWIRSHPANERFLTKLEERGVNTNTWLSEFPKLVEEVHNIPDRPFKLYFEQDPLHIMQMGNYFHTCLSFEGINAFSVVANATDLNKRVLYVLNNKGRVIARKLVGINTKFELVGFRTYTIIENLEKVNSMYRVVNDYCKAFATACGLPLGDQGSLESLVTSEWYDDGICAWDQLEE
jgi:hypothetical protein